MIQQPNVQARRKIFKQHTGMFWLWWTCESFDKQKRLNHAGGTALQPRTGRARKQTPTQDFCVIMICHFNHVEWLCKNGWVDKDQSPWMNNSYAEKVVASLNATFQWRDMFDQCREGSPKNTVCYSRGCHNDCFGANPNWAKTRQSKSPAEHKNLWEHKEVDRSGKKPEQSTGGNTGTMM